MSKKVEWKENDLQVLQGSFFEVLWHLLQAVIVFCIGGHFTDKTSETKR
ncbi:MAG: hypothetical protein ACI32N_03555 [Bulleidia sp.]